MQGRYFEKKESENCFFSILLKTGEKRCEESLHKFTLPSTTNGVIVSYLLFLFDWRFYQKTKNYQSVSIINSDKCVHYYI